MKRNVKILSIVLIVLTLLSVVGSVVVFADEFTPGDVTPGSISQEKMTTIGGKFFAAVRIVGTIISVVILAILGIKYMTASPEGKADYKANMIPYLVGAVLLFAASNIASMVYNWINDAAA